MSVKPNKPKTKNHKKKREFKLRYSFLTLVLLCCLTHVGISAFYNMSKTINYQGKIRVMSQLKEQALQDNIRLKEEVANFNNIKALETIAREQLKMVGANEVLVMVNKRQEATDESSQKEQSRQQSTNRKTPVKFLTGRKGN